MAVRTASRTPAWNCGQSAWQMQFTAAILSAASSLKAHEHPPSSTYRTRRKYSHAQMRKSLVYHTQHARNAGTHALDVSSRRIVQGTGA